MNKQDDTLNHKSVFLIDIDKIVINTLYKEHYDIYDIVDNNEVLEVRVGWNTIKIDCDQENLMKILKKMYYNNKPIIYSLINGDNSWDIDGNILIYTGEDKTKVYLQAEIVYKK